jgi:predicted HicB family RNase H-like nuclease
VKLYTNAFLVRCTETQHVAYLAAASQAGLSLSAWVRAALDERAIRQIEAEARRI